LPKQPSDEALEEELRQARAQALVEMLKDGDLKVDSEGNLTADTTGGSGSPGGSQNPTRAPGAQGAGRASKTSGVQSARGAEAGSQQKKGSGPSQPGGTDTRPEKTIGRM
jgi:hypothetical protein